MKSNKVISAVVITALTAGATSVAAHAAAKSQCPVEKCYGIVKKAKNDCGTPKHACAAQATRNSDPQEWMYVMKGTCASIVGGHLHPPKTTAK